MEDGEIEYELVGTALSVSLPMLTRLRYSASLEALSVLPITLNFQFTSVEISGREQYYD